MTAPQQRQMQQQEEATYMRQGNSQAVVVKLKW
jgi:hypothetical protein